MLFSFHSQCTLQDGRLFPKKTIPIFGMSFRQYQNPWHNDFQYNNFLKSQTFKKKTC